MIDKILNAPEAHEVGLVPYMAWALQALGEDERAEQIWRASDRRLMGHVELARFTADLGGRIPFDLAWTPNFARRLAEAGVEPGRLEIPLPASK